MSTYPVLPGCVISCCYLEHGGWRPPKHVELGMTRRVLGVRSVRHWFRACRDRGVLLPRLVGLVGSGQFFEQVVRGLDDCAAFDENAVE